MATSKADKALGDIMGHAPWKPEELEELLGLVQEKLDEAYNDMKEEESPQEEDTSDAHRERSEYHPDREI